MQLKIEDSQECVLSTACIGDGKFVHFNLNDSIREDYLGKLILVLEVVASYDLWI